MFAQAYKGLTEGGGLSSALSGLTKGMGSTLMMVMEWTWAWRLAEIPLNAVVGAINEVITTTGELTSEQHASGASIQEVVRDLGDLGDASIRTSTEISKLAGKRQELRLAAGPGEPADAGVEDVGLFEVRDPRDV